MRGRIGADISCVTGFYWLIGIAVCAAGALLFLALVANILALTEAQLKNLERREAWARQRRIDAAKAKSRRKKAA